MVLCVTCLSRIQFFHFHLVSTFALPGFELHSAISELRLTSVCITGSLDRRRNRCGAWNRV